jgi:hypothetical protein
VAEKKSYWELLKDPRWQRRRLEILSKAGFRCESCGSETETLNVHHVNYRREAKPWEYVDCELQCLCETCHQLVTVAILHLREGLRYLPYTKYDRVVGYAMGLRFRGHPDHIDHFLSDEPVGAFREGFLDAVSPEKSA